MTDESASQAPAANGGKARGYRDLVAGLTLVAVALFALWASADLPTGRLRAVGPGMVPRIVALFVLATGAVLVALALVKGGEPLGRWPLRGAVFVTLGVVAFALTIRTVGLAVAGPTVVLVSGAASRESRPVELLLFAVVMTAFCVGLFRFALGLPIPVLIIPGVTTI